MRQARPLGAGEHVDVETAAAPELARLPRVGPRLAKTIVADRTAHGPFGGPAGLDRVPGVGPGLLKIIAPHLAFSGRSAQQLQGANCARTDSLQSRCTGARSPAPPVNLNSAGAEELDALPGIGPAKAAAIVQYRSEHGPFANVNDLVRVPGFGPGVLRRLQDHITAQ
jgi:competence protein ComEA